VPSPRSSDRGSIEARKRTKSRATNSSLRGHPTAAPLKLAAACCLSIAGCALRGHPTAAPLKQRSKLGFERQERALRGHPTAAPLKRCVGRRALDRRKALSAVIRPRLH